MKSEAKNNNLSLLFVFDGEVKEGEEGGFVLGLWLGRVDSDSEHGDEWLHGFGKLAATPLGGFGEPSDLSGCLELGIGVVRLDQEKGSLDSGGRRGGGYGSGHVVVGLGIGVGATAMVVCSGLHHCIVYTTLYICIMQNWKKSRIERRKREREGL